MEIESLKLYTQKEAADILRIDSQVDPIRALRRIRQTGQLKCVRIGRKVMFRPVDLTDYIESRSSF